MILRYLTVTNRPVFHGGAIKRDTPGLLIRHQLNIFKHLCDEITVMVCT